MATAGPRYPGFIATEAGPSGDNDWLNPSNIGADDGAEAQITAATYDAGDHSFRLIAQNFGFDADVPAGSTIDGILVEIDRRDFAGDAQDQEVRLYDSTGALVGDDKQTATSWPTTSAVASYGGSADTWAAGLDANDIRSSGFGVALIVLANAANTDIGVDFIRVTVTYSPPSPTGTGAVAVDEATLAGEGVQVPPAVTGAGAITGEEHTLAASGSERFTGTGALTGDEAALAASGGERFTGTGAVAADEAALDGTGTHTESGITGTGAVTADEATLSGSGAELMAGTSAITVDDGALAASGGERFIGSGAVSVDDGALAGSGVQLIPVAGSGTLIAEEPVLAATGNVPTPPTIATGGIAAREAAVAATGWQETPAVIRATRRRLRFMFFRRRF